MYSSRFISTDIAISSHVFYCIYCKGKKLYSILSYFKLKVPTESTHTKLLRMNSFISILEASNDSILMISLFNS